MTVWAKVKKWAGLVSGLLLMLLGAGWLWQREKQKRLDAEAEAQAERLKSQIGTAAAVRQHYIEAAGENEHEIRQLDEQIASNERALLRLHDEDPEEYNDVDSIRKRLSDLGY